MAIGLIKPINDLKAAATERVNTQAGEKILGVYPDWKQRNMTARMLELVKESQGDSAEGQQLTAAWDWIKSIRAASNVANTAISSANTANDIYQAEQAFKQTLNSL